MRNGPEAVCHKNSACMRMNPAEGAYPILLENGGRQCRTATVSHAYSRVEIELVYNLGETHEGNCSTSAHGLNSSGLSALTELREVSGVKVEAARRVFAIINALSGSFSNERCGTHETR